MPYNRVERTRSITVLAVKVTLTVSPGPPWTAGQTVMLRSRVVVDKAPWAGATVVFSREFPSKFFEPIVSAITDSDGYASITHKIPWKTARGDVIPCHTVNFYAGEPTTPAMSPAVPGAVAFPTRISISAPGTVRPNVDFTVIGKLEYESASGVWSPHAGKTVSLFYNTTKITDGTTKTDGSYSITARIPTVGTYTLKASYAGEGFGFAPAFAVLGLPVGVPPELAPVAQYATYALAAVPILAVVGAIGYNELMKKRW